MKKFKWTMIPAIVGAVNTTLLMFDVYHLTDAQLNALNELASLVLVAVGIVQSHDK